MHSTTRRSFAAGLASALSASRVAGANDRVGIGYIGVGNRGDQVHDAFLEYADNQTVALCDLRDDYMDHAARKSRGAPARYRDYRRLLDDKNVDAVVISTPDHWHAIQTIDACRAGKDVYVEKPLSLTVVEGRRMVAVARETNRVTQVGIHRRSAPFLREAAEFVRSGGIGHVTVAKGYNIRNEWPRGIGKPASGSPPNEEEWDRWLGPAPLVPYTPNRTYYDFRWFWHYSGGQVTNFGVHYMDMLRWSIGAESPTAVMAMGGHYAVEDNREVPDTAEVVWEFPGGTLMTFSQYNANGAPGNVQGAEMEIRGTKGTLYIHGNRWEVVPERVADRELFARTPVDRAGDRLWQASRRELIEAKAMQGSQSTTFHARNFLDCVRSRQTCHCDIETGHLSTAATLIANVALRTRRLLEWDGKAERFTNHDEANRHLHYQYRAPYTLG